MKIIIVGGGWAGCAAALQASKLGTEVILLERTDMLLGTGLVGGIFRNNGRYTATEELIAMGGGKIFEVMDATTLHADIEFPGHHHASLYNVGTMEPIIRHLLLDHGVKLALPIRINTVEVEGGRIKAVSGKQEGEKVRFEGDAFIDTTGTAGPPANCNKHGNGCAMCVLRCHSFGGRVSITAKAGVQEIIGRKGSQIGAMSGSCKLHKESLDVSIVNKLNQNGVITIPVPEESRSRGKLAIKACQQYAMPEFEENIVLLDSGHAKLMTPFFPLEVLRTVPGFENARYEDPYAGGLGNSIRFLAMAPRDDALKVKGVENLFCAGEKAGLLVGHTEAICTGTLAGYNAVKHVRKERHLSLPDSLVIGDAIRFVRTRMATEEGLGWKYTFSGSVYFERMKARDTYTQDTKRIEEWVGQAGLSGVFSE
jgi:hypothetical protein